MRQAVLRHSAQLGHDTARARQLGTLGVAAGAGARRHGAGVGGALACGTGAQQAQAALAWGAGRSSAWGASGGVRGARGAQRTSRRWGPQAGR